MGMFRSFSRTECKSLNNGVGADAGFCGSLLAVDLLVGVVILVGVSRRITRLRSVGASVSNRRGRIHGVDRAHFEQGRLLAAGVIGECLDAVRLALPNLAGLWRRFRRRLNLRRRRGCRLRHCRHRSHGRHNRRIRGRGRGRGRGEGGGRQGRRIRRRRRLRDGAACRQIRRHGFAGGSNRDDNCDGRHR